MSAIVEGPSGKVALRLALDTGSTRTMIAPARLQAIGCRPDPFLSGVRFRSVTGTGAAPMVRVDNLSALDLVRADFVVVSFLPQTTMRIDGLLGLDFIRDHVLQIDFRHAEIELS